MGRTEPERALEPADTSDNNCAAGFQKPTKKAQRQRERKQRADEGEESAKQVLWEWVEVMQVALEK